MDHRESFGMLGTPLHYGVTGEHKLSIQNKMAPTLTAYAKLKQTKTANEERELLESTSVWATNGDNLYASDGRCAEHVELMDKEDKAQFRVKETLKRNRVHTKYLSSLQQTGASSFLAKSAEIPEIAPKQARTVHGYGVLQAIYSLRGVKESKVERKVGPALNHVSLYSSPDLFRESRKGLGYRDEEKHTRKSEYSKFSRTYDIDEDDAMDEHANAGYKDLDSTAKLLSQRFQESRANWKGGSAEKRRFGNADHALEENVRFSQFSQSEVIGACLGEWTVYEIPASFTADPTHRFETDSMKTTLTNLPEYMREKYETSLKLYTENRKKETEALQNAVANAKEERDTRSRRIRDLIVKDMGSRFIEPNDELQTQENVSNNPKRDEPETMSKNTNAENLKRCEARRTSQSWEPDNLLCKRLGVETWKPILRVNSSKTEAPGCHKLLSSYGDDEEFLIHSVKLSSAGIMDLPDKNILTSDQLAELSGCENFHDTGVNVCNYGANIPSNKRLAQAIFTNAKIKDGSRQESRASMSSETNLGGNWKRDDRNRGVHRTRAVDFF